MRSQSALLASLSALLLGSAHAIGFTVGIGFDLGGRRDDGFNQTVYQGVQRVLAETGGQVRLSEPRQLSEVGVGIPGLVRSGAKVVIGVGFANNAALTAAAAAAPGTRFILVDDLPKGPNTVGLRFREQEGSFLAGYLAGKQSATGRVGFIGGTDIPVIGRFKAGFEAGVAFACPDCQVTSVYVSDSSAGFNLPGTAKLLTAQLGRNGNDIIYAAAGASGRGVIDQIKAQPCLKAGTLPPDLKFRANPYAGVTKSAAYRKACAGDSRPMFFIGVDTNQNALGDFDRNPATLNHGLTSMLKRVDNAVYAVVKDVAMGRPWRSGDRSFGLNNGGVGLAFDGYNKALVSPQMQATLKKIEALIVNGTVKVPAQ
ncbi:BMP family ABC transporter substrate-binding protein [Deinococcus sp. MIMF12]|uniref:BMP family ABC transporter substrate-binding protein n=1 Tax=Deinococcus rhizophilus TaxID=3049544 RepID=A0ABT7JJ48_9DEIO|nr:BMP family ABC transporter substrate-binding protein [Deinococcus rhizophilus]MDL2344966.1 BMP family ABC transporter substrate-binding protein [Deinococcus rhizophilus]